MRINCAWHARHPMPPDARLEQQLAWHLEHQRHCGCRPAPIELQLAMLAQLRHAVKRSVRR